MKPTIEKSKNIKKPTCNNPVCTCENCNCAQNLLALSVMKINLVKQDQQVPSLSGLFASAWS